MYYKKTIFFLLLWVSVFANAQPKPLYFKDATKEKRTAFYNKIVNGINKTFALPFTTENEDSWQSAFYNIGLIQYKTTAVNSKIDAAAKIVNESSIEFKKAFLNLVNSNYPNKYSGAVLQIFYNATTEPKLMAMAANYLLPTISASNYKAIRKITEAYLLAHPDDAIITELSYQLKAWHKKIIVPSLQSFFDTNYMPGQMLVISLQRSNRAYPGLAMVRKGDGSFIKNDDGTYFSVGQLARSNSNMPGYITNGNTPQGIFRLTGFDTSTNYFIGPTPNLQLAMPHEYNPLVVNNTLIDTTWSLAQYTTMLPTNFKNYHPIYGTFYAGKAGRTEIIAHGTTIDVDYYKNNSFYPYTPTAGCLCTKEIWNDTTGIIQTSDQQKLANAVQATGVAKGYLIVIDIDDKKEAVTFKDVEKYLYGTVGNRNNK